MLLTGTLSVALTPLLIRELVKRPKIARTLSAWWKGAEYLGEAGVVRQDTPYECGVACLQMIFDQKGITASGASIRSLSRVSERGASMLGLKRVAEAYGLKASVWSLRKKDILQAPLPLIAFVDKSHFVVISEITVDHRLIVLDPSAGRLRYSLGSFKDRWDGEVILFSDFIPANDSFIHDRRSLESLLRFKSRNALQVWFDKHS
jgi:ABC-type bacteriocin/lantibiotic exporter with double-glycine peptidase domain